jgi:hypothetical protein
VRFLPVFITLLMKFETNRELNRGSGVTGRWGAVFRRIY